MENIIERARTLRAIIEGLTVPMTDEAALEAVELFPNWNGDGFDYAVGDRVRYNDVLYKVLTAHTSQQTWNPADAPSLFAKVLIPGPEIPEWEQPSSTNPYMKGDMVKHNGKTWKSLIDNNVWEPSEAVPTLWEEV